MNKLVVVLMLLLQVPLPQQTFAQLWPKEDGQLHYRIIGFRFPSEADSKNYKVEIALGNFKRVDSFEKNILVSYTDVTNRIIGEVPAFGKYYTWRVVSNNRMQNEGKTALHHFRTLEAPEVDTNNLRLRIIKQAEKYSDAYVFLDLTRTLYDMKGNPVWFLPNVKRNSVDSTVPTMDLKPTPFGTLTYIFSTGIYEITYDGDTVWKGPENNTRENDKNFNHYHHEFTRLPNGHYMVLGSELFMEKLNTKEGPFLLRYSDTFFKRVMPSRDYLKLRMGMLSEYDSKGKLIWWWKSSKYLEKSDLNNAMRFGVVKQLHDNAFFFDEANNVIYVSFRVPSRVVKLSYPEARVIADYGKTFVRQQKIDKWNNLFCDQHSCRRSSDGYLYLYNNNNCNGGISTIVKMREPLSAGDTLKTIWEYECSFEGDGITEPRPLGAGGGNVIELADHDILCSTGYFAGKVFIVNMDKKIVWSALPEKWNPTDNRWEMGANHLASYRASFISREDLNKMISVSGNGY